VSLLHRLVNSGAGILPEERCAGGDVAVAVDDAVAGNPVPAPGAALRLQVVKEGVESVQRGGVARLGGFLFLELFPEGAHLFANVRRKEAEDPVGGLPLGSSLSA